MPTIQQKPPEARVAGAPATKRQSTATAVRRLEVPAIDGYHLHWFAESRVPWAKSCGYELVKKEEVAIDERSLMGGNTDLGSDVSLVGSRTSENMPNYGMERIILMKIKQEWFLEDQDKKDATALAPLQAIFGEDLKAGEKIRRPDGSMEYVKTASFVSGMKPLLNRPARKIQRT